MTTGPTQASDRDPGLGSVVAVALVAAIGGLLFGYDTGVISGALLFIEQEFALSSFASGVVVSSILVGAMAGAAGAGGLADRYGRRRVLIGAAAVFTLGALLAGFAANATMLTAARVVLGIGIGTASNLVPLFIAEVAPARQRGRLVALNQLMITFGIVLAYVANYGFADVTSGWRWMFAIAAIPAILFGIGMMSMPETPRWLALQGDHAQARSVLAKLRGKPDDMSAVDAELREMTTVTRSPGQAKNRWRALSDKRIRPALVAGIGLQILGQASGVNTVIYYAPTIFSDAGLGQSAAILATVGVGVVNLAMTPVGMLAVDRFGRKKLLMTGASVMTLALLGLTMTFAWGTGAQSAWIAVGCVVVFIAAVSASLNVVVFIIPSELYPLRVRGTAMSATLFSNWAMNFLVALTFLSVLRALGGAGTFTLYAAMCAGLVVFTAKFIPETKSRTLEEIERDLTAHKG